MSAGTSKIIVLLLVASAMTYATYANGQIIATPNIEKLCKSAPSITFRRTVVYVDIASVQNAKPEWGLTILNRLELAPREPLIVIGVNPSTFEVREVFDTCYPALANSEMEQARRGRGMWDRLFTLDPGDQQRETLQTFDARLRNALDVLVGDAKKYQEGGRRNVLGAIALDKNRYSDRSALYRVIVYTDGVIKEPTPQGTPAVGATTGQLLFERYPVSFSGAEVSVFGIQGSGEDTASKEQLFAAFLLKSWAHLKSFSPSLPQQDNFLFPPALRMDGVFEGGGSQGSLKLALFAAKQGNVSDGWLAFNVGRETLYVPFQGEYRCNVDDCRLTATCSENVPPQSAPYFRRGDKISLAGKNGRSLEGSLEADVREVFKDRNQTVRYSLKFLSSQ